MARKSMLERAPAAGTCLSSVDGEIVGPLIVGTTGERYHGREVVVFRQVPGLYGTREGGREVVRRLTLNKGLLNQCALVEPPSPSWAVIDAACELREGFTRQDVLNEAVKVVGEGKREACLFAWDILRNHQRHERKRDAGMSVMFDALPGGKTKVRARTAEETKQYFEWLLRRKGCKVVNEVAEPVEVEG